MMMENWSRQMREPRTVLGTPTFSNKEVKTSGKWEGIRRRDWKRVARGRTRTKRVKYSRGHVTHLPQEGERLINWLNAADTSNKIRTKNWTFDLAIFPSPINGIKQKIQYFPCVFAVTHAAPSAWVFCFCFLDPSSCIHALSVGSLNRNQITHSD